MKVGDNAVQVEVHPLVLRLTLSRKLPPAAMGPLIDNIRRQVHQLIELEVPVYDELRVQPARGWAVEIGFGKDSPVATGQPYASGLEAAPAETPPGVANIFGKKGPVEP